MDSTKAPRQLFLGWVRILTRVSDLEHLQMLLDFPIGLASVSSAFFFLKIIYLNGRAGGRKKEKRMG